VAINGRCLDLVSAGRAFALLVRIVAGREHLVRVARGSVVAGPVSRARRHHRQFVGQQPTGCLAVDLDPGRQRDVSAREAADLVGIPGIETVQGDVLAKRKGQVALEDAAAQSKFTLRGRSI
jgi:hypothetical protein